MKFISAKCPNCGANLNTTNGLKQIKCNYCDQIVTIDSVTNTSTFIRIDDIQSNADLIDTANELLNMQEYLKAKKKFLLFSEKNPNDYQGWLGLLICRTRNFTIRDKNNLFENDIKRYHEHFLNTAPEEIKEEYREKIEHYFHPEQIRAKKAEEAQTEQVKEKIQEKKAKQNTISYRSYIIPVFFIVTGISLFFDIYAISGFLWLITGLLLFPKLNKKTDQPKKKAIKLPIILGILGFCFVVIKMPYPFEGNWTAENESMNVWIEKKKMTITLEDGEKMSGAYQYQYQNQEYKITFLKDDQKLEFRYDSKKEQDKQLCLYENESCTLYFQLSKKEK